MAAVRGTAARSRGPRPLERAARAERAAHRGLCPWSAHPGSPPSGGGRRSSVVAVVAATAVVLAAGITGFLVLDGDGGRPDAGSTGADVVSPSASPGEPRGGAHPGTGPRPSCPAGRR